MARLKKYVVTRTVTMTVTDVYWSQLDPAGLKEYIDSNEKSLAGELSELGIADNHRCVEYSAGETTVMV